MEMIGKALALIVVLMAIASWHESNGTYKKEPRATQRGIQQGAGIAQQATTAATVTIGTKAIGTEQLKLAQEDALRIITAAKQGGVPEGILLGIVMMESRFQREGWGGNTERWILARELPHPESKCSKRYGTDVCAMRFERLKAICTGQARPVCDPDTVRVTYGMAMGPAQQMPQWLLMAGEDGGLVWSEHAKDGDGDGVINPLDLDDALAITASQIRKNHDKAVKKGLPNPWREAAIVYAGRGPDKLPKPFYYDGRIVDGKAVVGVSHYWTAWQQCRKEGNCPAMIAQLRAR